MGVRTQLETFPSSQTLEEGDQDAAICHLLDLNVKFRFGHFWLSSNKLIPFSWLPSTSGNYILPTLMPLQPLSPPDMLYSNSRLELAHYVSVFFFVHRGLGSLSCSNSGIVERSSLGHLALPGVVPGHLP